MECVQKGLWMEFQKQMNLCSGAAIFSSVEIFQHPPLHDKIVKRGEEIGLGGSHFICAQIPCKQGEILSVE